MHRSGPRRSFLRLDEVFGSEGIMRERNIGEATVRLLDAGTMIECIVARLRRQPDFLVVKMA